MEYTFDIYTYINKYKFKFVWICKYKIEYVFRLYINNKKYMYIYVCISSMYTYTCKLSGHPCIYLIHDTHSS